MITNCWFDLSYEKEEEFRQFLLNLPDRYTMDEFWKKAKKYKIYISDPPTRYLLNFITYPWNLDKNANLIYNDVALIKTKEHYK